MHVVCYLILRHVKSVQLLAYPVRNWYTLSGWLPTHEITHNGRAKPVMLEENAFYTAEEWLFDLPADWEVQDWRVLFQGQVPDGEYEIAPIIYQM